MYNGHVNYIKWLLCLNVCDHKYLSAVNLLFSIECFVVFS